MFGPITVTIHGNLTISGMTVIAGGTVAGNVQQKGGSLVTSNAIIGGALRITGGNFLRAERL